MSVQATEREALFLGGDERAADALVRQNDGLRNKSEVVKLANDAKEQSDHAA